MFLYIPFNIEIIATIKNANCSFYGTGIWEILERYSVIGQYLEQFLFSNTSHGLSLKNSMTN